MDKANILLAAAVIIIAACAIYIFTEGDMDDSGSFDVSDSFSIRLYSDGGTPETYELRLTPADVGDGKYYYFYDFPEIMPPGGNAPDRLWPEDYGFGFHKIKVMAGTGTMADVGDGWYQWDKDQQQYRKFDDKEVYYSAEDSSEMDIVIFAGQTLSLRILWTTAIVDVTYYSNNSDMLTKHICYAADGEMQSGYLPDADFFTSQGYVIKGWSDQQHCSVENAWKPGDGYFDHCGTSIFAIWGPAEDA